MSNFFFSDEDIPSGKRWELALGENLDRCDFGIIVCTPNNLSAPWLLFEAGALSKKLSSAQVCPLLFGADHEKVAAPLQQFQMRAFNRDNFYQLIKDINQCLKDQRVKASILEKRYDSMWPELEDSVSDILKSSEQEDSLEKNLTENKKFDPVKQLKSLDLFTFCGIRNDIVLDELEDADDLEQIYFLWADAAEGSTVSAEVVQANTEKFIRIKFNNKSSVSSNVAIRPGGMALLSREKGFQKIKFKARIPSETEEANLKKVQVSIRVIDALTTHWKYIKRTGYYEPLTVNHSSTTDEWLDIEIDLVNLAKWQVLTRMETGYMLHRSLISHPF